MALKLHLSSQGFLTREAQDSIQLRSELERLFSECARNEPQLPSIALIVDRQMPLESGDLILKEFITQIRKYKVQSYLLSADHPEKLPPEIRFLSKTRSIESIVLQVKNDLAANLSSFS